MVLWDFIQVFIGFKGSGILLRGESFRVCLGLCSIEEINEDGVFVLVNVRKHVLDFLGLNGSQCFEVVSEHFGIVITQFVYFLHEFNACVPHFLVGMRHIVSTRLEYLPDDGFVSEYLTPECFHHHFH